MSLPPPDSSGEHSWRTRLPVLLLAGVLVFTVGMMLVSFPVGLYTVFGTHLSQNVTASTPVYGLNWDLFFVNVPIPIAGDLGDLFVALSVIYFLFFVLAAEQGVGFTKALRESASEGYLALFRNPLTAMLVLLGATSLVTVLVDTAQTNAGVPTGSLSGDPFSLLIDFTLAPLLEESGFRMVLIGVPVLVLSILMLRGFSLGKAARVLWRPSSLWDVDETEESYAKRSFENSGFSIFPDSDSLKVRALKPVVYAFLVLSSLTFGYAHYAAGSGWGPGKISEAALAGLALGYLYIKYGLHTDILLHWSINYVGTIFSFLAQGLYGIPYTSGSGSLLDVVPTLDLVFILGIPSTLIVANELLKGVTRGRGRRLTGSSGS